MADTVQISGFVEESITDGPGLRCTVFFQGCPHRCQGCHNPETHAFGEGIAMSVGEVLKRIEGSGLKKVTFSGGEPLAQAYVLHALVKALKGRNCHIMLYTGYRWERIVATKAWADILPYLDVLVDGPFVLAEKSLELWYKGSKNQRVLDVVASLRRGRAVRSPYDR